MELDPIASASLYEALCLEVFEIIARALPEPPHRKPVENFRIRRLSQRRPQILHDKDAGRRRPVLTRDVIDLGIDELDPSGVATLMTEWSACRNVAARALAEPALSGIEYGCPDTYCMFLSPAPRVRTPDRRDGSLSDTFAVNRKRRSSSRIVSGAEAGI